MKVFITGATGFIGSRLALCLANNGIQIHAIYRDESKIVSLKHPNIAFFKGDILDYESLMQAMNGCSQIYHVAAFARVWDKDISSIYRLNVEGTLNVVKAGIESEVKRIVCTSTAGVLGPTLNGRTMDENSPNPKKYFIDYECSKKIMEEALKTISMNGPEIIIVNPSRVYGPGILSESNGVTRIIQRYINGKWRIVLGNGESIGNYVYVDDVVTGLLLAMEKGKSGERYILGGTNMSFNQFYQEMSEIIGRKYYMIHLPLGLCQLIASVLFFAAQILGRTPLITPALIRKYKHNWIISSAKAEMELNYHPIDFKTGATLTINWLKQMK